MSFFGKNIKKIRATKKLSQTAFADLFNIKRASIGAYEEGRAEAKIDKIIEIANHFKLTLNQLLTKEITLNEIYRIKDLKDKNAILNTNEIPFLRSNNFIEYIKNTENKVFINSLEKLTIPDSKNCSIAFEYFNNKMLNFNSILKQGSILICEKLEIEKILNQEKLMVVVVSKDSIYIGRLSVDKEKLMITHDNSTYKTDKLQKNEIMQLFLVKKMIINSYF